MAIAQLAHRLAGSAASLGGQQMQGIARTVEQAGERGDWPVVDAALTTLDEEWQRVRSELEQF